MKTIFFTFDDGPSDTTEQLLAVLKKHGVKACFFVTNEFNRPELLKKIAADGHTLGLHSYTHDFKTVYSSAEAYFEDLKKIDELVYRELGIRSRLVRLPGGTQNTVHKSFCPGVMEEIVKGLLDRGYHILDWDCENGDGLLDELPMEAYITYFLAGVKDRETVVYLSHNRPRDSESIRSVDRILTLCEENGWKAGDIRNYIGALLISAPKREDPYLMLVNKENMFSLPQAAGIKLANYEDVEGYPVKIEKETLIAYLQLKYALFDHDITIGLRSAFRSVPEQKAVWDNWLARFDGCVETCMRGVALPWMSEHHTGLAIDFMMMNGDEWPGPEDSAELNDERFSVIHSICHRYGFIVRYPEGKEAVTGYWYEPWHLRYVGVGPAAEMYEKGLTLEEYTALHQSGQTETST